MDALRERFKKLIVLGFCLATVIILMFIIVLSGEHKSQVAKVVKKTPQNTTPTTLTTPTTPTSSKTPTTSKTSTTSKTPTTPTTSKTPTNTTHTTTPVRAEVGKNITLNCALQSPNKKLYFVSLTKYAGEKLVDMKSYSSKDVRKSNERVYLIPGTAKLNITNVTWEDGGQYECKVFYGSQPSKDKEGQKGTWFNLEIEPTKKPVDTTTGKEISLFCGANNLPSYIPFQWTKDGKPLPSSHHTINTITGTLTIHKAEKNDSGLYACELMSEKRQKYYPMSRYLLAVRDNVSKPGRRGTNRG